MFCSGAVSQNIKSPHYRKVPVNDRRQLNNVHVIKAQVTHNYPRTWTSISTELPVKREKLSSHDRATRWRLRTLDRSSDLDGGAGGGVIDRSGWKWGETQSLVQLARSEASAFPDRRQRVLTTTRYARSRLLLVSQLPSDRIVHSTSVQSTPSSSTPTQLNRL